MKIVETIAELRRRLAEEPRSVGFVPTMGAFHEGHLSLMRTSKRENARTVASLFVNPTQFGPNEDYRKYPRDLTRDAGLADSAGVDFLFAPNVGEIYPRDTSKIVVPEVTARWEGAHRPGHFDGVATVVAKLLNIVQPARAYFGWKDLQQCVVIGRMVEDLNLPVQLAFQDTYRESDGLAMSSRNVYLTPQERAIAPTIYAELTRCGNALKAGSNASAELRTSIETLTAAGFYVDYFALVDLETLEPVADLSRPSALIVAARLGTTRLIDNLRL